MAVVKPAEPRIVDLLVASGVELSTWTLPGELYEERSGPPLTHDDLLDFHLMLDGDRTTPGSPSSRPTSPAVGSTSHPLSACRSPTLERLEPPLGAARARHGGRRGRRSPSPPAGSPPRPPGRCSPPPTTCAPLGDEAAALSRRGRCTVRQRGARASPTCARALDVAHDPGPACDR